MCRNSAVLTQLARRLKLWLLRVSLDSGDVGIAIQLNNAVKLGNAEA